MMVISTSINLMLQRLPRFVIYIPNLKINLYQLKSVVESELHTQNQRLLQYKTIATGEITHSKGLVAVYGDIEVIH